MFFKFQVRPNFGYRMSNFREIHSTICAGQTNQKLKGKTANSKNRKLKKSKITKNRNFGLNWIGFRFLHMKSIQLYILLGKKQRREIK